MQLVALLGSNDRGAVTLRLAATVALVAASASAGAVGSGAIAHAGSSDIKICHATGSASNPYVRQSPSESGDLSGHAGHVGDIIPPIGAFPGLNWTAGEDILKNKCNADLGVANRPPVAVEDVASATTGGDAVAVDVLANDSDPDEDDITVTAVGTAGTLGRVVVSDDRASVLYTPPARGSGNEATDAFTYAVTDGALTSTATVMVDLQRANRPPVAVDDVAETGFGVPVLLSVLDNDSDPDADSLVIDAVTGPEHGAVAPGDRRSGTVSLRVAGVQGSLAVANGLLTYLPADGFSGPDTFTYLVSDGLGGTDSGLVTVQVGEDAEASPSASPTVSPSASASPIGGVTSPDPATGSPTPAPTAVASAGVTASPTPAGTPAPTGGGAQAPTALPFTGSSTDLLLGLGAGLSVVGLLLALTGRRRRAVAQAGQS